MADESGFGEPEVIWSEGGHQIIWLGAGDPSKEDGMPSNQYMIVDHGEALVIDPGGHHVFDRVYRNVSRFVDLGNLTGIFISHQDPDVAAGIDLWVRRHPQTRVIMSGLWVRFLMHLPLEDVPELLVLRDSGDVVRLRSGARIRCIPAHFLHSPGNFHLYDETSRTLFSGDVGAAVVPVEPRAPVVDDFEDHTNAMVDFHQRYMSSNKAVRTYLSRLARLEISVDTICPQHGAIMKGQDVERFFRWLGALDVGVDAPAFDSVDTPDDH